MRLTDRDVPGSFREIEREDGRNFKRDQEVEPVRFVLKDTVDGQRYEVTVASGVLTLTAV